MDYSTDLPARVTKLAPVRARDAGGRDLLPALLAADTDAGDEDFTGATPAPLDLGTACMAPTATGMGL